MAAATVTVLNSFPVGPKLKVVVATVTLVNPHTAAGDTVDLSAVLPTQVHGGWQVGQSNGYKCDYVRAALGDPATGLIHGYYADNDAAGDGALITAAGQNLSGFSPVWLFIGY
jgi:hypothetical protein